MRQRQVHAIARDAWLCYTGASLLLAIGTLFSTVAYAGQGVWTSGGPYGGDVRALAINPANPATLYAGTLGGGVFKSTDSGATWAVANAGTYNYGSGLTNLAINALAINPSNPATIYAGTNGGVFKSADSGGNWVAASLGLSPYSDVNALAIDPATPNTLFAGTEGGGVFKSTDAGNSWAAANTGLTDQVVNVLAINPSTPGTLYAGTSFGRGVFKSTDSGGTWAAANVGLSPYFRVEALAIDPATPSTLYAGTDGGVFKSTDSGGTWTAANAGLTSLFVNALAINPSTPTTLYAGTYGGVFKSTDSGATWAAANTGLTAPYGSSVQALAVSPATPATLYAGTYVGVFKSNNSGAEWVSTNAGMNNLNVTDLAINPSTPATLFAAANGGVFRSTDSARTWVSANAGLAGVWWMATLAIDPTSPTRLYAASYGAIFKSTDSGGTWSATGPALPVSGVNTLAIDPVTPSTLYAGTESDGVFKSIDSGGTWTAADVALEDWHIRALAINPKTPATLYVGTRSGIFRSTDAGGTWVAASTGLPYLSVSSLAIDPTTPATIYAGTYSGGVFKSIDSGATWTAANAGLLSYAGVFALTINPASPHTLYAGTWGGGVFKSTDSGGTWAAVNTGLTNLIVNALALDPEGATTLYAGLEGGSVWQMTPTPDITKRSTGFVPIVLDVTGLAHFTSELQLTNLGASSASVKLSYTSSIGSGSGDVLETIPAGQQVVYPDAISYLRFRGVPIPASGNQGGTLLVSAPAGGIHVTCRTGADTATPQPVGRSGLAYTDSDPVTSSTATKMYVYGLRTNDADRSNLAVYNMGAEPVSFKVSLVSGDDGRSVEVTAGAPLVLPAYGWYQYSGVLTAAGFSSGYAIVERVSGSGPFGAYGVVNDQLTNDGSFIPALSGTQSGSRLTIPVLVETSAFESELILTNRGSAAATFTLRYVESLSPASGTGGTATVDVAAGRQRIIPKAIDFLRSKGVGVGARGAAGYAGGLQVQVSGVGLENVFAGARTSSLSPAGGEFGLFCQGIDSSQEFSGQAFVLGLKADFNNRSNVAVLHTGAEGSGPITLKLQVLDGSEGGKAVGQPFSVDLSPGQWAQPSGFFAGGGVPNGYVRIRRTAGTAPWFAYGVINDGGQPGQRTGDGSYVAGVQP
jgi:photosystem II stability/assembly factor-like uncharacterized protein